MANENVLPLPDKRTQPVTSDLTSAETPADAPTSELETTNHNRDKPEEPLDAENESPVILITIAGDSGDTFQPIETCNPEPLSTAKTSETSTPESSVTAQTQGSCNPGLSVTPLSKSEPSITSTISEMDPMTSAQVSGTCNPELSPPRSNGTSDSGPITDETSEPDPKTSAPRPEPLTTTQNNLTTNPEPLDVAQSSGTPRQAPLTSLTSETFDHEPITTVQTNGIANPKIDSTSQTIATSNLEVSNTSQTNEISQEQSSTAQSSETSNSEPPTISEVAKGPENELLEEVSSVPMALINDNLVLDSDLKRRKVGVLVDDNNLVLDPELKRRKVEVFVDDPKPKWYNAEGSNITKTIDPEKLVEAFSFLPVSGRPKDRSELKEFQESKLREFVGGGLDDKEFEMLAEMCSPEQLETGRELVIDTNIPNLGVWGVNEKYSEEVPDFHELCIVKKYKMRVDKDLTNTYAKRLKYRGIRIIPFSEEDGLTVTLGTPLQPGKDLLYRVRIYRPFPHSIKNKVGVSRFRHSVFSYDVVLLGRQKLSELRDRIVCANDVDMRLDVSDRIDDIPTTSAKDVFPSGFMFINNVFYVDTRPNCRDISERIRRWAANKPNLGHFPRLDMNTRLDQMKIKLGHPEVYVHQGHCEHLFTFSEIRLLNASDPLKISHYPASTAISQNQSMYCTTCAELAAKWIVTDCERVPFDPAYFCDSCFRLYMYKDGKKIGNFKAYTYKGNELNMLKRQG